MSDRPLCATCQRPVADMAYVCQWCARPAETALRELAIVAGESAITIARLARLGDAGAAVDSLVFSWEAADAQWAVANTLTTWARHIIAERGNAIPPAPGPVQGPLCRAALACRHHSCTAVGLRAAEHPLTNLSVWLAEQVTWLRHRQEAVEALDELLHAARLAMRTVDNPPDRWYAGRCLFVDEAEVECQADLYALPGADTVRCPECGILHDADERREWLLGKARDQLAYAEWLSSALTRLGHKVTSASIRGLAHRGRILAHSTDEKNRPLYRLGDVLDLVVEQERRAVLRDLTSAA